MPTPKNTFQAGRVALIAAGHAVHDTYIAFLPTLLPVLIQTLSISRASAGLFSVFTQLPSLLQPFIGYVADRVSLRWIVILSPLVTCTLMSLVGVAPTYLLIALLLLGVGVSSAALHATGPVLAGKLSGETLGRGMSFWMVGGEMGRTLGPLVIAAVISSGGLRNTPWLILGGAAISALLYVGLQNVHDHLPNPAQTLPWRAALRAMAPVLVPLTIIITFRSMLDSALTTYLPVFLTDEGAKLQWAGISLALMEAAGVVGALLSGSISDRIGRRVIFWFSIAATPVFTAGFLLTTGALQIAMLLGMGFALLCITPAIMALVQESFPENRALANGLYMAASFVIRSGAIYLVGLGGDWVGLRTTLYLCAGVSLLALPFIPRLPQDRIRQA